MLGKYLGGSRGNRRRSISPHREENGKAERLKGRLSEPRKYPRLCN